MTSIREQAERGIADCAANRDTPESWDAGYRQLWNDLQDTQLRLDKYRRKLTALRQRHEKLREALNRSPCYRLLLQETPVEDAYVVDNCPGCDCWRAAIAADEGEVEPPDGQY